MKKKMSFETKIFFLELETVLKKKKKNFDSKKKSIFFFVTVQGFG